MYVVLAIALCAFYGFYIGKKKPLKLIQNKDLSKLNSNPKYYGYYIFLWCLIPALITFFTLNFFFYFKFFASNCDCTRTYNYNLLILI